MPNQAIPGRLIANGNQILPATTIQNVYDMSDPEHKKRLDHILAGLSVLTFTHTKTGALHQLTGKDGAEYIGFTATADYQEDDTWELNGVPLDGVDFMNGEPLCVGGLITGDTVMGRVVDGTLTLFLDRPASNPNILDNWYFIDPINQRGQTEYQVRGYTIDMWRTWSDNMHVSLLEDGVLLDYMGTNYDGIYQYFENGQNLLVDKTVTISALTKEYGLITKSGVLTSGNSHIMQTTEFGDISLYHSLNKTPPFFFRVKIKDGKNVTVIAAKLEFGPRQTLAHKDAEDNWVLNDPPPNKQQELAKCQRYQMKLLPSSSYSTLGTGMIISSETALIFIPIPTEMRSKPILLNSANTRIYIKLETFYTNLKISIDQYTTNGIRVFATGVFDDSYIGAHCMLQANNNSTGLFLFDANL